MFLLNGQAADSLPLSDRGLHYGDGLFQTIAVVDGRPRLFQRHLARLNEGCARLALPAPDPVLLAEEVQSLSRDQERAVIKIMVTRGSGGRGYCPPSPAHPTRIVARYPWPAYPAHWAEEGVCLFRCNTRLGHQPLLAGIKHLNRIEQVLARSEWADPDIAEGLMCDLEDNVVEGTMSNLFIETAEGLETPLLDRCGVNGVMRELVMEWAAQQGIPCREVRLSDARLESARGVFITNSLIRLWPVRRIGQRDYAFGELTPRLAAELRTITACE